MSRIKEQYNTVLEALEKVSDELYVLSTIIEEDTEEDVSFESIDNILADAEESLEKLLKDNDINYEGYIKIKVSNIEWELEEGDDEDEDLPTEMIIGLDDDIAEENLENAVGYAISDETGFLHRGFTYEVLGDD